MDFDEDYFERGIETGKSCYQNYRWIPELTIPMAMTIIECLEIRRDQTILDFGCAKGFLVKAFRLLYREAWGIDASAYAMDNVDPGVEDYCFLCSDGGGYGTIYGIPRKFDTCIAKDVFEHIPEHKLPDVLINIRSDILFVVVPLGENGSFTAPSNDMDVTHVNCQPLNWWAETFAVNGWWVKNALYQVKGIKDTYYEKYPEAHGFFVLERQGVK